jgi:hypothetical protein
MNAPFDLNQKFARLWGMEKKQQRTGKGTLENGGGMESSEQQVKRARGGGQPNELGVTQGQNGEQGNTREPRNARPPGKLEH